MDSSNNHQCPTDVRRQGAPRWVQQETKASWRARQLRCWQRSPTQDAHTQANLHACATHTSQRSLTHTPLPLLCLGGVSKVEVLHEARLGSATERGEQCKGALRVAHARNKAVYTRDRETSASAVLAQRWRRQTSFNLESINARAELRLSPLNASEALTGISIATATSIPVGSAWSLRCRGQARIASSPGC